MIGTSFHFHLSTFSEEKNFLKGGGNRTIADAIVRVLG